MDNLVALVICEMAMQQLEIFGFLDGMGMSRAFRAGVEKNRRIKAPTRQRRWQPLRDLAGLEARSKTVEQSMGRLLTSLLWFELKMRNGSLSASIKTSSTN